MSTQKRKPRTKAGSELLVDAFNLHQCCSQADPNGPAASAHSLFIPKEMMKETVFARICKGPHGFPVHAAQDETVL